MSMTQAQGNFALAMAVATAVETPSIDMTATGVATEDTIVAVFCMHSTAGGITDMTSYCSITAADTIQWTSTATSAASTAMGVVVLFHDASLG